MISRLLEPLLSLHGWEAYPLVGVLVFAEDAVMLGFVFPGETAAILGGVLASKGGVSLGGILAVVIVCAIVGDSVGYAIGDRWGRQLLQLGPLRKRQKGIDAALDQLSRRGAIAVFVGRFSAFLRAVIPGLAGLSKMRYRVFLPANALGGICWGFLFVLLGYFVGQQVEKATGIASDILLGLIAVVIVVLVIRHRRKEQARDRGSVRGRRARERRGRLTGPAGDVGSGRRVEDRTVPGAQTGEHAGEFARGVVPLGVGVQPAHRRGIAAVQAEEAEARLVGAPLVVVDQRPVEIGAHGHPGCHRVGHRPEVLTHVARPVHPVVARPRGGRRGPGSTSRSPPPTAGGPGAGRPRWRTRTAARRGAPRRPTGPARRTSRARPSGRRRPGTRMAWLATGSYQSKPTASRARGREDACAARPLAAARRRRVRPRRRAQAGPSPGRRSEP